MPGYWLIPSNAAQSGRPNWRNMSYLRTGAYKGMGRLMGRGLGQYDASGNYIGPTVLDPNTGLQVPAADVGTATATGAPLLTQAQLNQLIASSSGGISASTWLLIGGGALLLFLALKGGR